jgi:hypothetical protein
MQPEPGQSRRRRPGAGDRTVRAVRRDSDPKGTSTLSGERRDPRWMGRFGIMSHHKDSTLARTAIGLVRRRSAAKVVALLTMFVLCTGTSCPPNSRPPPERECNTNGDCDIDAWEACVNGLCVGGCDFPSDADCDDGKFCNGSERSDGCSCTAGVAPCAAGVVCDDAADVCGPAARFQAVLTGAAVVPSIETDTNGIATFELDTNGAELSYHVWIGADGAGTSVHLALGGADANGPVVAALSRGPDPDTDLPGVSIAGRLSAADLGGELEGQPLSALVDRMRIGGVYVEWVSADGTTAAVRGQIDPVTAERKLALAIHELWMGYYADTWGFMGTVSDDEIGPDLFSSDTTVYVAWLAAVYEDCSEPDAFVMTQGSHTVLLSLEDVPETCATPADCSGPAPSECTNGTCVRMCDDNDYVSNATAGFTLPSGTYLVAVSAHVRGFQADNGAPGFFEITFP